MKCTYLVSTTATNSKSQLLCSHKMIPICYVIYFQMQGESWKKAVIEWCLYILRKMGVAKVEREVAGLSTDWSEPTIQHSSPTRLEELRQIYIVYSDSCSEYVYASNGFCSR